MRQRRPSDRQEASDEEGSPIGARLQRSQPGIILAIALTLAAAVVLLARHLG